MSDEQMQSVLDEWFEDTDPQPPSARRTATRVMAQVPQTRQRGRWLPFGLFRPKAPTPTATDTTAYQPTSIPATNGHSPTVIGRTQSMFSPVKAITAGALVFAIGGAFLIAQPFGQQGGSVPGAATDTEAAAPVEFTAKWAFGPALRSQTSEAVDGVAMTRGGAWRPGVITQASDPRLQGTLSIAANNNLYSAVGVTVWHDAFRIENDEGAWQEMPSIDISTGDGDLNTTTGVLVGEGGYAGLIAVFDKLSENSSWTLHGYIIDGELPPAPEPVIGE